MILDTFREPVDVPVRWLSRPMAPPFHGVFVPLGASLDRVLESLRPEQLADVELYSVVEGCFVIMRSMELIADPGHYPLKRIGSGPFVYAPADVASSLPFSPPSSDIIAGVVREGRVRWVRLEGAARVADLLVLSEPRERWTARPARKLPPPLSTPPQFAPEPLPRVQKLEQEQARELENLETPKPGIFARLFGRKPPSAQEWAKLKQPPPRFLWGPLRAIARWIGSTGSSKIFDRLARLFETGDVDLALKHAVPIDDDLMSSLRNRGLAGPPGYLPERNTDFSLGNLGSSGGASFVMEGNELDRLRAMYQKAAQELMARGNFRRAAYVYATLLKDYRTAAMALERGGFHLEAAALWKEKLGDARAAAQVLARGGHVAEAVQVYLELLEYDAAAGVYESAGLHAEATGILEQWGKSLAERELRVQAADVFAKRLNRPQEAQALLRQELASASGQRGQAAIRLVDLADLPLDMAQRCDRFLRRSLDSTRFAAAALHVSEFHAGLRDWAASADLKPAEVGPLRRMRRESLLEILRLTRTRNASKAARDASAILASEFADDPFAPDDLRRALETPENSVPLAELVGAAIHPMPDGRYLLVSGGRWALADARGVVTKELPPLPRQVQALAVHAEKYEDAPLLAMVAGGCIEFFTAEADAMCSQGARAVSDAVSIVAAVSPRSFFLGGGDGKLYLSELQRSGPITCDEKAQGLGALRFLHFLAPELLCGGGSFLSMDCFWVEPGESIRHLEGVPSDGGGFDAVDARGPLVVFLEGTSFGYVRRTRTRLEGGRIPGLRPFGVSSLAVCGCDSDRQAWLAVGYHGGDVVIADVRFEPGVEAHSTTTIRTHLTDVVAMKSMGGSLLLAADAAFRTTTLDVRRGSVLRGES